MKIFAVALFFTAIFGYTQTAPREEGDLAEKIRQIINDIIDQVPESLGVKDVDIKIPLILINAELNIKEIGISGLKNFDIDTLTYDQSSSRLDYTFHFEDIISVINTHLTLEGLIDLDHPLLIKSDLKNLKIEGYAVVAADKKSVEDFNILLSLEASDFDIKGLLNDEKLSEELSKTLTENVYKVFNEIAPKLSPIFSEAIKTIINIILKIEG